jgi:hypothetical protein
MKGNCRTPKEQLFVLLGRISWGILRPCQRFNHFEKELWLLKLKLHIYLMMLAELMFMLQLFCVLVLTTLSAAEDVFMMCTNYYKLGRVQLYYHEVNHLATATMPSVTALYTTRDGSNSRHRSCSCTVAWHEAATLRSATF